MVGGIATHSRTASQTFRFLLAQIEPCTEHLTVHSHFAGQVHDAILLQHLLFSVHCKFAQSLWFEGAAFVDVGHACKHLLDGCP